MLRLLAVAPEAACAFVGLGCRRMSILTPTPLRLQQIRQVKELNDYFPKVVEQLKAVAERCNLGSETAWLERLLYYTVPGGKMVRCLTTYHSVMTLNEGQRGIKEKAMTIGWAVEMTQASVLIIDDISDGTNTRRGKDAWHVIAGKDAVFDSMLVENCMYCLMGNHCEGQRLSRSIKLLYETMFQICMGQNRDNHCTDNTDGRALLDEFTMDRYIKLCEHKSGGYTFYTPVGVALYVSGIFDNATHDAARDMASDLGLLYQAQDDYLDAYGEIERMGKPRTDVQNGKGSWVITEALLRANDEQRQRLKDNYGFHDQTKVDNVMKVYEELNMKQVFIMWEKSMMEKIESKIEQYARVIPPEIFRYSLETVKYHINR